MTTVLLFSNAKQAYFAGFSLGAVRYTTRPERAKSYISRRAAQLFSPDEYEFVPVEFDNSPQKEEKELGYTFFVS